MNQDYRSIDRLLHRASDQVRASARAVSPRPVEDLERRPARAAAMIGVVAVLVATLVGLEYVRSGSELELAPAASSAPAPTAAAIVCRTTVDLAGRLAAQSRDQATWRALADDLDRLRDEVAVVGELPANLTRRVERFLHEADRAVDLATADGYTPAFVRAEVAVELANAIVDDLDVAGCTFGRTNDPEPGG